MTVYNMAEAADALRVSRRRMYDIVQRMPHWYPNGCRKLFTEDHIEAIRKHKSAHNGIGFRGLSGDCFRAPCASLLGDQNVSRKHFKAIADAIAKIPDYDTRKQVASEIATACAAVNKEFSRSKFYEACKVK